MHYEKDMKKFYEEKKLHLNFNGKKDISADRMVFMEKIIRATQFANYRIEEKRKQLHKYNLAFSKNASLSKFQKINIKELADEFDVKLDSLNLSTAKWASVLDELSLRIQIVPVRLALAQAIIESAWGESRFVKEGNAYFGIHCYDEGCGIPFGNKSQKVFVKSYPDLQSSVDDYIYFLNTKPGQKKFRMSRHIYFKSKDKNLDNLISGLDSYSEYGENYERTIKDLLKNYIPNHIEDY